MTDPNYPATPPQQIPPAPPIGYDQQLQAPQPGTYYNNVEGRPNYLAHNARPGMLTTFLVLEWITLGYGVFGILGALISFITSASLLTIISTLILRLAVAACALVAAIGIIKNKKIGITFHT